MSFKKINPDLLAILAENGMGDGMEQYLKFRGQEPTIDPLLENRGLK